MWQFSVSVSANRANVPGASWDVISIHNDLDSNVSALLPLGQLIFLTLSCYWLSTLMIWGQNKWKLLWMILAEHTYLCAKKLLILLLLNIFLFKVRIMTSWHFHRLNEWIYNISECNRSTDKARNHKTYIRNRQLVQS